MDRILELLTAETASSFRATVKLLSIDVLESAQEPIKHKLKTKISSLLKSTGHKRAYGAILARVVLQDWSAVKSHGGSWVVIMIHALDLPDQVCWKPITRTLTDLFVRIQGKPDLIREIGGGSKIGDFIKRLITTLPYTRFYSAASRMFQVYPTQSRPYINKLLPVLQSESCNSRPSEAIASTCISERNSADVWQSRVAEVMHSILKLVDNFDDELSLAYLVDQLAWYIRLSGTIRVKVPAQPLMDMVIKMLNSLQPLVAFHACQLISETFEQLKPLYVQRFEDIVYQLGECFDLGLHASVQSIRVIHLLVTHIGWVSEKFAALFARLQKRVLKILERPTISLGAEGLADYVQNQASFAVPMLSKSDTELLAAYLATVSINVPGLPQSLRVSSDRAILKHGTDRDIVRATLYPAKYSILPLSVARIPSLAGMEALIHPRFPPLNSSKGSLMTWKGAEADDEHEIMMESHDEKSSRRTDIPLVADDNSENPAEEVVEANVDEPTVELLPTIPESHTPKRRTEVETPPEKRAKVVPMQNAADKIPEFTTADKDAVAINNAEDSDEGEEIEIPELNMDSD